MRLDHYHITAADFEAIQLLNKSGRPARFISVVGGGGKSQLIKWLASVYKAQGYTVCIASSTKTYLPEYDEVDGVIPLASRQQMCRLPRLLSHYSRLSGSIHFLYKQRLSSAVDEPTKVQGFSVDDLADLAKLTLFDVLLVEADGAKHLPLKAPAEHEPCVCELTDLLIGVIGAEAIFAPAVPQQIHRWQNFSEVAACKAGAEVDEAVLERLLAHSQGLFKNSPKGANKLWLINKMDRCLNPSRLRQFAQQLTSQTELLNAIWLSQLNIPTPTVERYFAS